MRRLNVKLKREIGKTFSEQKKLDQSADLCHRPPVIQGALQHFQHNRVMDRREIVKGVTSRRSAQKCTQGGVTPEKDDFVPRRSAQPLNCDQLRQLHRIKLYEEEYKLNDEEGLRQALHARCHTKTVFPNEQVSFHQKLRAPVSEAQSSCENMPAVDTKIEKLEQAPQVLPSFKSPRRITTESVALSLTDQITAQLYCMYKHRDSFAKQDNLFQTVNAEHRLENHLNEIFRLKTGQSDLTAKWLQTGLQELMSRIRTPPQELEHSGRCSAVPASDAGSSGRSTPVEQSLQTQFDFKTHLQNQKVGTKETRSGILTSFVQGNKPKVSQNDRFFKSVTKKILEESFLHSFIEKDRQFFNEEDVAKKLVNLSLFNIFCKKVNDTNPGKQAEFFHSDPQVQYFVDCQNGQEHALPVLNKIEKQMLLLSDYKLSQGQCDGLGRACELESSLIQTVMLDNCGLKDAQLASILHGLLHQSKVKQIFLKRCEIGEKSAGCLLKILAKKTPAQLEDLRLESCPVQAQCLSNVLEAVRRSHLQTLRLIDISIPQEVTKSIGRAITAKYLQKIDLTFCKVTCQQAFQILSYLSLSQRLEDINLAQLPLGINQNFGQIGSCCDSAQELDSRGSKNQKSQSNPRLGSVESPKGTKKKAKGKKKLVSGSHDEEVARFLQEIIQRNCNLRHLDISDCNLTAPMILDISRIACNAPSLVGLHLSGNPGLSDQVITKLLMRFSASYEQRIELQSFSEQLSKRSQVSHEALDVLKASKLRIIQQLKALQAPYDLVKSDDIQRRHCILTRKLGHDADIPGSSRWQLFRESGEQCYVCDQKVYTVFLWSPKLGKLDSHRLRFTPKQQQQLADLIFQDRERNLLAESKRRIPDKLLKDRPQLRFSEKTQAFEELYSDDSDYSMSSFEDTPKEETANPAAPVLLYRSKDALADPQKEELQVPETFMRRGNFQPVLYGNFNEWQPQPMIKLRRLVELLFLHNKPDFLEIMKTRKMCRQDVNSLSDLFPDERKKLEKLFRQLRDSQNSPKKWQSLLEDMIVYDNPHVTTPELFQKISAHSLYFVADFVGSGRQDYCIQYGKQMHFYETIVKPRSEPLMFPKNAPDTSGDKRKARNPNVFKKWQKDSTETIENCLQQDFKAWKVGRFLKDPADMVYLRELVKKNYAFLKEVYLTTAARSVFPCITIQDFAELMMKLDIPESGADDTCTQGIIDTQFIAARTDAEKKGNKLHNQAGIDINRFEFFEALVRVAGCKWVKSGRVKTYTEALALLLNSLNEKFTPHPWQVFRDQLLWTRDVNLMLDANLPALQSLYKKYSQNKVKKASFAELMQLMTEDCPELQLKVEDAKVCYAMSLMTCAFPVHQSKTMIDHMSFVEFLELVGRVADCFLFELNSSLAQKVSYVLDVWLPLVESEREEPRYYEDQAEGIETEAEDQPQSGPKLIHSN